MSKARYSDDISTSSAIQNRDTKPWYTHKYLWLVIMLPLMTVVACIGFVVLSFKTKDNVVRDDWYMDGKTLYQDVSRDKLAADMDMAADLSIRPDGRLELSVTLPDSDYPPMLDLSFYHATAADKDRKTQLRHIGNDNYLGQLDMSDSYGKYYIEVSGGSWRLREQTVMPKAAIHFEPLPAFD